jgi:hypothetical protein
MEAKVSPKRRDNSPTPGGDILEDIIEYFKGFYLSLSFSISPV